MPYMNAVHRLNAALLILLLACLGPAAHAQDGTGTTAFVHVNVVPMDGERVLPDQTVVVRNGHVAAMGAAEDVAVPQGATEIDGRGKYLMPGLIDMAVYGLDDHDHLPYMMHGVTTIRHARGATLQLAWREEAKRGEVIGPDIYNTRNMVDNAVTNLGPVVAMAGPEEAEKIVKMHTDNQYDYIRVTYGLNRDSYFALAKAAEQADIPIMGNVPRDVRLDEIRNRTILDYSRLILEMQPDTAFASVNITVGIPVSAYWSMDESRMPEVVRTVKAQGLQVVPMNASTYSGYVDSTTFEQRLADPALAAYRPGIMYNWRRRYAARSQNQPMARVVASAERAERIRQDLTRALYEAEVPLLMGTRGKGTLLMPGVAAHAELAFFVESGLPVFAALQTATTNAAAALGATAELGTIAVGKQADLLLLNANPLDGIAGLQQQVGVMTNGRWYSQGEMQRQMDERVEFYQREAHFMSILEDEGVDAARAHYRNQNDDQPLVRQMRLLNYVYALAGAQQRFDNAMGVVQLWEEIYPDSWLAPSMYGYVYDEMGEIDQAIAAYQAAWEKNPYYYNFSAKEEIEKLQARKAE